MMIRRKCDKQSPNRHNVSIQPLREAASEVPIPRPAGKKCGKTKLAQATTPKNAEAEIPRQSATSSNIGTAIDGKHNTKKWRVLEDRRELLQKLVKRPYKPTSGCEHSKPVGPVGAIWVNIQWKAQCGTAITMSVYNNRKHGCIRGRKCPNRNESQRAQHAPKGTKTRWRHTWG
jgi:hypothetical protein